MEVAGKYVPLRNPREVPPYGPFEKRCCIDAGKEEEEVDEEEVPPYGLWGDIA